MRQVAILLAVILFCTACVNDNEKDLFPRPVLSDSAFQGQIAWYTLDSGLFDLTGRLDPLTPFGEPSLVPGFNGTDSAAVSLDGVDDYFRVLIGNHDSLAISMWFCPFPAFQQALLFDYGAGKFAAGIDAVTSATMPRFRFFLKQDTTTWYFTDEMDFFYWTYLYIELGDTLNPPRLYVNGYMPEGDSLPWTMHPLVDLLYLGRGFNKDITDSLMYRGYYDDIRIFNQFLSEEEILSIFWDGRPQQKNRDYDKK